MAYTDIVVRPDGTVTHVHSDAATSLTKTLGAVSINRASYVEPDSEGRWFVDLEPVGGPRLGPYQPDERDQAIEAEILWLRGIYLHITD